MDYIIGASRLGKAIKKVIPDAKILSRSKGLRYTIEDLKPVLKDASVVFLVAGSVNAKNLVKEHVDTAKAVVKAMPKNAWLIYASSISVYGKGVIRAEENTAINPDTLYAKAKALSEKEIAKHKKHIILRIGTMYGIEYASYIKMLKLIDKGKAFIIGSGNNSLPLTYIQDVAQTFKLIKSKLIAKHSINVGIYNIAGSGIQQEKLIDYTAHLLGKSVHKLHIPIFLARFMGFVCDTLSCFLNTEAILSLSSDRHISSKKAKHIGIYNETPINKGIKEVVLEYVKSFREH